MRLESVQNNFNDQCNILAGFHTGFFVGEGKKRSYKVTHVNTHLHLVMHIVIEGPDLKEVNFNQVQRSEPSHSIIIIIIIIIIVTFSGGGVGEILGAPIPV